MKGSSTITISTEKESINGVTDVCMKESGAITECITEGCSNGRTEESTWENT